MPYVFGDSDLAARRPALVHEVFSASTRPFLVEHVPDPPDLAIDLGCGPGLSTHFLVEVTSAGHVAGLDSSPRFIALARPSATNRVQFFAHDVTVTPFPVGPADLLYARLLLTHLADPSSAVTRWTTQLRSGGRLLLDEVESIETKHEVFRTYLGLVADLIAHEGGELYIGPRLEQLIRTDGVTKAASDVRRLAVDNFRTAGMFYLNLQNWKRHPFIGSRISPAELHRIEHELRRMAEEPTERCDTEWSMRQAVYVRS